MSTSSADSYAMAYEYVRPTRIHSSFADLQLTSTYLRMDHVCCNLEIVYIYVIYKMKAKKICLILVNCGMQSGSRTTWSETEIIM